MKRIYWYMLNGTEVIFELNWLECFIMKRIFNKKKYKMIKLKPDRLKGEYIDICVIDEYAKLK